MKRKQLSTKRDYNSHYIFTKHARDRMSQRRVNKQEVFMALRYGEQEIGQDWSRIYFTWVIPALHLPFNAPTRTIVVVDPWTATILTVYRQEPVEKAYHV